MDDTLCDYHGAYHKALRNNSEIKYPQSQVDFYRSLKPLDGAIEVMQWMLVQPGFDPHILAAPSVKNPNCYLEKRLWVGDHLGEPWLNRLHISPHKGFFKGDFLIDCCTAGRDQDRFNGIHIRFGQNGYKTWSDIQITLNRIVNVDTPIYTLSELLAQSSPCTQALDEHDHEWLNEVSDIPVEAKEELVHRIDDFNDSVRYVIRSMVIPGDPHLSEVYWNLSDGTSGTDINRATLFKDKAHAQAVINHENDSSLGVIQVTITPQHQVTK
jgi:hypothetical protein